jgi:peptidoglycan/LPS O-acetylase OafA/YrhL
MPEAEKKSNSFLEMEKGLQAAQALNAAQNQQTAPPPPKPVTKPRIDALDSLRFFLIAYIATGHFISFATSDAYILKLIGQINVVVGGFFVISGYVAAYTTTELGEPKYNEKRLKDPVEFAVSRIMGFWPLHFFVLFLFSPMFFWVDSKFNGPIVASWHGLLSVSLLQAWFPLTAEAWNAPTWFLSAFSFALCLLPYALKVIACQSKRQLRRSLLILTIFSIITKLGYSYDLKAWYIMEGNLNAKTHPNYALFNSLRFSPLGALVEVLMGVAACRLVMLDTPDEIAATGSSLIPLVLMIAILVVRAAGLVEVNDLLVRSCLFIPLFISFLMRMHRESVGPQDTCKPVPKFLNLAILKWLGGISFPIFIVHGPVGQLFYKKVVAKTVFGDHPPVTIPGHFAIWWLVVILFAAFLNKYFVQNKKVQGMSKNMTASLCKIISAPTN